METLVGKRYDSGKLYGVYRCSKRSQFLARIPYINNKPEITDVTGIVLAGIANYGNDPETIRAMAAQALGGQKLSIPYEDRYFAKLRFIRDLAAQKLLGTGMAAYPTNALVGTFYDFMEMPTAKTKELQAASDAQDLNRYLSCETRRPAFVGPVTVDINGTEFTSQQDLLFAGMQDMVVGQHMEGRRKVNDTAPVFTVECVKIFPGKPQVRQSSKVLDGGVETRLELYVMLKAAEQWCMLHDVRAAVLKASYYYLKKDTDSRAYSPDFFSGKGGNVVSLTSWLSNVAEMDARYQPQIEAFLAGASVDTDKCQNCQVRIMCGYKGIQEPLPEGDAAGVKLPQLSAAQEWAANALSGCVRVVATAGSGKTTAMAYRILNLLKNGVQPEKIGCFTFTNAGAAEMAARIRGYCKAAGVEADVDKITIMTIHAFGDSLLKKYYRELGYANPPVLINEVQRTKLVEGLLSENPVLPALADKYENFYLDMFRAKGILELTKGFFGQILEGKGMEDFMRDNKCSHETADAVYRLYAKYVQRKKDLCLIEHSDQERGVLRLLEVKPGLFDEVGLEHISVDEYQDTSNVQFEIVNAMRQAKCTKSLFVVGDDDQSIYGFRESNVKLIQDFFGMVGEDGKDIHLMENRRSTPEIVGFADRVIACNADRIPKHPVAVKGHGEPVTVSQFFDREAEQSFIVNEAERLIRSGREEGDIAVLAATNAELADYAALFEAKGIHTASINPEAVLVDTRVSAAVSFVKFMSGNNELYGMNYVCSRNNGDAMDEKEAGEALKALQEEASGIFTVTQLFDMFDALDPDKLDEIYQGFLEDIRTAKEAAVKANSLHEVCEYVLDFERFGKKQTARKEKAYAGVVLSTMHSSKGKEWPVVFCSVTRMHGRGMTQEEIPEKNRVLFVACTRAKDKLYVTGTEEATGFAAAGDGQNMFLAECLKAAGGLSADAYRKVS